MNAAARARAAAKRLAVAVDSELSLERRPEDQNSSSITLCVVCNNTTVDRGLSRRRLTFLCQEADDEEPVLHHVCDRCDDVWLRNSGDQLAACPVCPDTCRACPVCGSYHRYWHRCENSQEEGPATYDSQQ